MILSSSGLSRYRTIAVPQPHLCKELRGKCWYLILMVSIVPIYVDQVIILPPALAFLTSSIKAHLGSTSWHPRRKWFPLAELIRSAIDNKTWRSIFCYFPYVTERDRTENCFCNFINTCYGGIWKGGTHMMIWYDVHKNLGSCTPPCHFATRATYQ